MRKPAKPGVEFDVKTGARAQVVRDETRPARTEGRPGRRTGTASATR